LTIQKNWIEQKPGYSVDSPPPPPPHALFSYVTKGESLTMKTEKMNKNKVWQEPLKDLILPNFDFFVFPIFAIKLGHFKILKIFSNGTNTQA
jgi:hypothetical protein